MPTEYTPTTEEVRDAYGYFARSVEHWEDSEQRDRAYAEFDRWLARVKADAAAQALKEAAAVARSYSARPLDRAEHIADVLTERATTYRKEQVDAD